MSIVFGVLAPFLILVLIGAAVVALWRGRLTFAAVVHAYTAAVLGVCMVLALVGGALLLKATFSEVIGRDFSYQAADHPYDGPYGRPAGIPDGAQRAVTQAKNDIATGVTLLVVGIVLGLLHAIGKVAAARHSGDATEVIERGFNVTMLIVASGVGMVSSVLLLNDLLRRYVVTDAGRPTYEMPHPGSPLAFVLTFLPLWVFFAVRVWRVLLSGNSRVGTPPQTASGPPTPAP